MLPPLAMKLWLSRRLDRETRSDAPPSGRAPTLTASIESLEHLVRNRMRMFLRHTWLVAILGTVLLVGAIAAGVYVWTQAERVRIAAGPRDIAFVHAVSDELARQHRELHLQILPTTGAAASAEAMSKGEADVAVLPSTLYDALHWPVIAILRQNVMVLIVPPPVAAAKPKPAEPAPEKASKKAGAGKHGKHAKAVETAKSADDTDSGSDNAEGGESGESGKSGKVADLAGKRVAVVTGNEATRGLLETVLSHYGVRLDSVKMSEIKPDAIAAAVQDNQVDALFVADASIGEAITDAVTAAGRNGLAPRFIAIDQADGIAKRDPALDAVNIDAGTFGGNPPAPNDDLKTLGFAEYLVARRSFHESAVATLAKAIYTARQSLALALPGEVKIEAPSTDKDAAVVLHPGALAYLSDSQQSFFDKYGDDIFYGMLIFPVFGSAIAAVASYLMSNTRTRRLRLLQRVLDLVRKAQAAPTLEAIEQLQIEADNLVIAIIHQGEHEEFDETARMSFSFALDQLRFALAGRRSAILDRADASGAAPKAAEALRPVA